LQQQSRQTRLFMLKWTGKLAVLSLVISLWASPVMACMLPDIALTVEERECCKDMANECGQMDMPSSHSCCKLTVRDIDSYLINARFTPDHSQPAVAPLLGNDIPLPAILIQTDSQAQGHSPPTSPPETISILRI
jgi:hypothetical protein